MHRVIALSAAVFLSACATRVAPPQAFDYDGSGPPQRSTIGAQEHQALVQRVAQLQQERAAVRERISARPPAAERLALYEQLHAVDAALGPLQRRLTATRPS